MVNEQRSNALKDFMKFFSDFRYILIYVVGLGSAPWLIEYIFNIGPPWPNATAVSAFTSVVIWLTLIWSFTSWETIQQIKLISFVRVFSIISFFLLCFYSVLTISFVVPAPDFQNREATGFILRDATVKALTDNPSETVDTLFKGAGSNPLYIWKSWTVKAVRSGLLICWYLFFGSLSFVISVFILHLYARRLAQLENSGIEA